MFRARFNEAFPAKLSNFGPQDIERGVMDEPPSPEVQNLLCALLALVLNRKKPVEYVFGLRRAYHILSAQGSHERTRGYRRSTC